MFLSMDLTSRAGSPEWIDLEFIYLNLDDQTVEGMTNALMTEAFRMASDADSKFTDIFVGEIKAEKYGSDEITVMYESAPSYAEKICATLESVAKLFMYLEDDVESSQKGVVYAYLAENGWESIDFDRPNHVFDVFYCEFDGDYEGFAREWMSGSDNEVDPWMEKYFDFDQYGEDLISDFVLVEWNGTEYLFTE